MSVFLAVTIMISAGEKHMINGDDSLRKSEIYKTAVKIAAENNDSFQVSPAALSVSCSYSRVPIRDIMQDMVREVKMQARWKKQSETDLLDHEKGPDPFFGDLLSLPAEIDWRKENKVTPVKCQEMCSSCWAFATTACLESAIACKTDRLVDLSEQDLMNCNPLGMNCHGGYFTAVELFRTMGAVLESDEPYMAANGTCRNNPRNYKIATWRWFFKDTQGVCIAGPEADQTGHTETGLDSLIKACIVKSGSCYVGVTVDASVMAYSGGIYNVVTDTPTNHAVLAVGYSDSGRYWIIKNSWSTVWGEKGFGYIAYGAANFGEFSGGLLYQGSSTP